MRPLLEYLKLKSAAEQLARAAAAGRGHLHAAGASAALAAAGRRRRGHQDRPLRADRRLPANSRPACRTEARIEFTADTISVKERISQIADQLEAKGSLTFFELFSEQPDAQRDRGHLPGDPGDGQAGADPAGPARELRDHQDILPVMEDLKNIVESAAVRGRGAAEPRALQEARWGRPRPGDPPPRSRRCRPTTTPAGAASTWPRWPAGYQFRTRPEYTGWIRRLVDPKPGAPEQGRARDPRHHRLQAAGHPRRRRAHPRRGLRRRAAAAARAQADPRAGPQARSPGRPLIYATTRRVPGDLRPQGPEGPAHAEGGRGVRQAAPRRARQRRDRAGRGDGAGGRAPRRAAGAAPGGGHARRGCRRGGRRLGRTGCDRSRVPAGGTRHLGRRAPPRRCRRHHE
ncbi:MAG: hypothetical protein MZV70_75830 [Desulfobacterales bacterium]|nr:hypothetical protein [Desulfobacterales bacterium]